MHSPIIIFDVDGVLLDSKGDFLAILQVNRERRHHTSQSTLHQVTAKEMIKLLEMSARRRTFESLAAMVQNIQHVIPGRFRQLRYLFRISRVIRHYEWNYTKLIPNTRNILEWLQSHGYILGAASNSEGNRIKNWFHHTHIAPFFQYYISRDERKRFGVKPHPGPLLALLVKLKRAYQIPQIDKSRVVFIGDLPTDILAGKAAGIKTIGVLSGHSFRSELAEFAPDAIINDITELPIILASLFPSHSSF